MVHFTNLQNGMLPSESFLHDIGTVPVKLDGRKIRSPAPFRVLQESLLEAPGHTREFRHEQLTLGVTRYLHLDHGRDDFGWFASCVREAVFDENTDENFWVLARAVALRWKGSVTQNNNQLRDPASRTGTSYQRVNKVWCHGPNKTALRLGSSLASLHLSRSSPQHLKWLSDVLKSYQVLRATPHIVGHIPSVQGHRLPSTVGEIQGICGVHDVLLTLEDLEADELLLAHTPHIVELEPCAHPDQECCLAGVKTEHTILQCSFQPVSWPSAFSRAPGGPERGSGKTHNHQFRRQNCDT